MRNFLTVLVCIVTLTSCGGGGGGGSGGGGSGPTSAISLSRSSISFSAERYRAPPDSQIVNISWSDSSVFKIVAGTPAGQTLPSWLQLYLPNSLSPMPLTLSIASTDLAAGEHRTTVRVATEDSAGNILGTRDISVTYTISEEFDSSVTDVDFVYDYGTGTIPSTSVSIFGPAINWSATTDQPWLLLSQTSGVSPSTFGLTIDTAAVSPGSYNAVITVQNNANTSETLTINVTLDVTVPGVSASPSALTQTAVNGAPIPEQRFAVLLDTRQVVNWTFTPSEPWISVEERDIGGYDFYIMYDPAAASLASGEHTGEIVFTADYNGAPLTIAVPVTLTLTRPTLTVQPVQLDFSGSTANSIVPQTITLSIDTFTNEHPYSVATTLDQGTGWLETNNGNALVSGRTDGSVDVSINPSALTSDQYTGSVDLTVQVNGDTIEGSVPVNLQLQPRRLFVGNQGVALVSTPTKSRLSANVAVTDNRGGSTQWAATSDQSWLTVTASGTTPDDLILTADPAGLVAEQIHYATVTLTSADAGIVNSGDETIRVGFYVTDTAPAPQLEIQGIRQNGFDMNGLIADPIRPYVYTTHNLSSIDVYHVYTGELVGTISNAGNTLRNMAVSSDGSMLYVLDYQVASIVTVDLDTMPLAVAETWTDPAYADCGQGGPCGNDSSFSRLEYLRINGKPVLLGGGKDIIDPQTGVRIYASATDSGTSFMNVNRQTASTRDGAVVYVKNTQNQSSGRLQRIVWRYDELSDTFDSTETHSISRSNYRGHISTDPWGDVVYASCDYDASEYTAYDGNDLTTIYYQLGGTSAHYGPDDLLYCVAISDTATGTDFWVMDPANSTILREFTVTGDIDRRQFDFSGDGLWAVTKSADHNVLTFTAID